MVYFTTHILRGRGVSEQAQLDLRLALEVAKTFGNSCCGPEFNK